MGVGKPFYVLTGPQTWCLVRMDHVAEPLHILLVENDGRVWFNLTCLKIYQFEIITWWCLYVLKFVMIDFIFIF